MIAVVLCSSRLVLSCVDDNFPQYQKGFNSQIVDLCFSSLGVIDSCAREVFSHPCVRGLPSTCTMLVIIATAVLSPNSFYALVLEEAPEEG